MFTKKRFLVAAIVSVFVLYAFANYDSSEYRRLYRSASTDQRPLYPPPPTVQRVSHGINAEKHQAHPIPSLIEAGHKKWASMLKNQSRTLAAAVKEYERRYHLPPPDGFELWFAYAKKHNVVLVDEYDELMTALAPLRKLGAPEVRRRADILLQFGFDNQFGGLTVGGAGKEVFGYVRNPGDREQKQEKPDTHKATKPESPAQQEKRKWELIESEAGDRTAGLMKMLVPVKDVMKGKIATWPAFSVPVNEIAEARVVGGDDAAWDTPALNGTKKTYRDNDLFHNHAVGSRSLVDDLTKACGASSNLAKRGVGTRFEFGIGEAFSADGNLEGEGRKPAFLVVPNEDNDMCQRPELMTVHGVWRGTRSTTKGLYPVLSYARPSAFSDIPIPSRYQWVEDDSYQYKPDTDIPWAQKRPSIYWRGEPSGGGHGDRFYGSMHRHRLVALTNPGHFQRNVTLTGASHSGRFVVAPTPSLLAQQLTNITFSEINDLCEMFGCELPEIFPFGPRVHFSKAWRHKVVIDSDGWGPSGRWRALAESNSLAVRSSVYREWFAPLMMPWVHYVPASVGLGELWGILGYFLGTPGGEGVAHDEEARKIANAGAKWTEQHFRRIDMTVYCFRLVLELNRLFNGEEWVYKG